MIKIRKGVGYMMLSVGLFALMHAFIKAIPGIPVHQVISIRSVISWVICVYLLRQQQIPWSGNSKAWLLFRGIIGTASLFCFFYSIRLLPLATAVTISNLIPLFTLLLAALFTQEKIKAHHWLFFSLSFAGVCFLKGVDERISMLGLATALAAALCTAGAHFTVRKLRDTEHPLVIMVYFPSVSMMLVLPYTLMHWTWPQPVEWIFLLFIGLCTHAGQWYLTKAYQAEEVSGVSYVYFLGIVISLLFGYVFFEENLTWMSMGGIVLILANSSIEKRLLKSRA
ncbi:MAG: DMT family transporter [Cytophagaceae bacterium]|nr:DMT family transporter [Cytophagaceae bacterium]